MRSLVHVVTSAESASADAAAIGDGIPSRALMQRAGSAAAAEISLRFRDTMGAGVLVLAGPGNNGGDAWVVARCLSAAGARVRVVEPIPSSTPDARAERELALAVLDPSRIVSGSLPASLDAGEVIVVDGLLGTGATGPLRGPVGDAVAALRPIASRGATIVALDVPSGLDASTGTGTCVPANLTITFGTVKHGHLINRDACGSIVVLDIGLDNNAAGAGVPVLVDERWVGERLPRIAAAAHKGTRKKIAIIGGAAGMAGAPALAGRAALRSGIGMVKLVVEAASVPVVQEVEPYAIATAWPSDDAGVDHEVCSWADAVVIGPGLGRGEASRDLLERVLRMWRGPTLLDADAITLFEGRLGRLAELLAARPALLTPHPGEFARIAGRPIEQVLEARFNAGREIAPTLGAAVLLKGTPTVISSPDGRRMVSAAGTPALATAGSGDVLSGIAGTLLAQLSDPFVAGAIGAWIHGRAAERVLSARDRTVRGVSLDDVVGELRGVWTLDERPLRYPVLTVLPALRGDR